MCPGCWEVKEARAFIEPLKLKPSCFRKCWSVMGHITRAWCTFNDISGHGDNTLHSDEILWSCWVEDCPHAPPSVSLTLLLPHRCFHVSKPLNRNLCIFFFFFFLAVPGSFVPPRNKLTGLLGLLYSQGFLLVCPVFRDYMHFLVLQQSCCAASLAKTIFAVGKPWWLLLQCQ